MTTTTTLYLLGTGGAETHVFVRNPSSGIWAYDSARNPSSLVAQKTDSFNAGTRCYPAPDGRYYFNNNTSDVTIPAWNPATGQIEVGLATDGGADDLAFVTYMAPDNRGDANARVWFEYDEEKDWKWDGTSSSFTSEASYGANKRVWVTPTAITDYSVPKDLVGYPLPHNYPLILPTGGELFFFQNYYWLYTFAALDLDAGGEYQGNCLIRWQDANTAPIAANVGSGSLRGLFLNYMPALTDTNTRAANDVGGYEPLPWEAETAYWLPTLKSNVLTIRPAGGGGSTTEQEGNDLTHLYVLTSDQRVLRAHDLPSLSGSGLYYTARDIAYHRATDTYYASASYGSTLADRFNNLRVWRLDSYDLSGTGTFAWTEVATLAGATGDNFYPGYFRMAVSDEAALYWSKVYANSDAVGVMRLDISAYTWTDETITGQAGDEFFDCLIASLPVTVAALRSRGQVAGA